MFKLRHRVMLVVVVASWISTIFSVDRNYRPIARIDPSQEPTQFAGSPQEPIVPAEPPDDVRKAERRRRAVRPAGDPIRRGYGLPLMNYEGVLTGGGNQPHPRAAEPLPPTYCHSIERVPKPKYIRTGPHGVHRSTIDLFENESGFGVRRMVYSTNDRGVYVASSDIDRVELVSLLTDDQPSVYVLDEMATPPLARQAKRRPLDEFERLGLDAVRLGEQLVWTREAPTRMFGAIRAKEDCLDCHANAKYGDLLGAFTYYLKVPVDRVRTREEQLEEKETHGVRTDELKKSLHLTRPAQRNEVSE